MILTMIMIGPCTVKRMRKCIPFTHVTAIEAVVICRYSVNHIVIVCPGNRAAGFHCQC